MLTLYHDAFRAVPMWQGAAGTYTGKRAIVGRQISMRAYNLLPRRFCSNHKETAGL
jgi:hypothetical protein